MKYLFFLIVGLALMTSCNKKKFFDGPDFYEDGFENYFFLDDLLLDNDVFWSFTQQTKSDNSITIDSIRFHSGTKSLKFSAKKSDDILSKCSIAKQNMAFWDGEVLKVSAWYYIEGTQSADWLFLFDLEEQTAIGAGPGMRVALVDNKLRIEHKFNEKDILQPAGQEIDFPRDQWVELIWEVKLSQKNKGSVKLTQNGQVLIDTQNNRTLPKDLLYSQQGTKGMYSSIEIGITANSRDNDLNMWVDDVKFEKGN